MNEVVFELQDAHYSYLNKFTALNGISMNIRRGEKIVLLGANGSGKSTLLQMLDGLIFPSRGNILFFGDELKESVFNNADFTRNFRSKVGFVFQNPEIQLFCPTVREDIVFGPLQFSVPKEVVKKRLAQLAESFDIGHLLERSPHQLSVGEKRKVAIASTLASDPDILILDEPTAGLDPLTTRLIVDIILSAHEQGKTVISATQDLHLVSEIADTVYILSQDKRIVRFGATDTILSDQPLLKENNLVHIHRHAHKGDLHIHPHEHLEHHT